MKKTKLLYLLLVVMIFGIASCSSDDEPEIKEEEQEQEDPIDIDDPDAVAESITFKNGTASKVSMDFPESTGGDALQLYTDYYDDEDIIAISGGLIELPLYVSSEIEGVYLQVDGAEFYYDVVINQDTKNGRFAHSRKAKADIGKRTAESYPVLLVELPGGIQAGKLCVKFAVYDAEKRISNSHAACVDVVKHGGENASFLTDHTWELESEYYKEVYGGDEDEDLTVVGETYKDTEYIYCAGQDPKVVDFEYIVNSAYLTFLKNGGVEMEYTDTRKSVNSEIYCETGKTEYISEQETEVGTGHWSYNDVTKELTWVMQHIYEEHEEDNHTEISVFKVSRENGKLVLTYEEEDQWGSFVSIITLKPKSN